MPSLHVAVAPAGPRSAVVQTAGAQLLPAGMAPGPWWQLPTIAWS
eukprot:SAG11_NODE_17391_length_520_cov_0.847981_1_plen_44_part_10